MSLMLALPYRPLACQPSLPAVRIVVWVLVLAFVVVLTALGSDPALALGVVLAALAATVGDLSQHGR
ncbi:hypothetical protein AB0J42_29280 [Nonomuraea sp. NPDC049649]|uniref:hypothetical protein n=1 Tax=Nonomuraea sp. NPDC049649 TaxID=3155776 RepID=UPI003442FAC0